MYAVQFCRNNPGNKIYRCMSLCSKRHHKRLNNLMILYTRKFVFQPVTSARYTTVCQLAIHNIKLFYTILIFYIQFLFAPAFHPRKKILSTSKYVSNTHSSRNISFFPSFGIGLELGLWSNKPISCNKYNHSTQLHTLLLIFISEFFASTLTLTKTGDY